MPVCNPFPGSIPHAEYPLPARGPHRHRPQEPQPSLSRLGTKPTRIDLGRTTDTHHTPHTTDHHNHDNNTTTTLLDGCAGTATVACMTNDTTLVTLRSGNPGPILSVDADMPPMSGLGSRCTEGY